jgi:hypothetical protein
MGSLEKDTAKLGGHPTAYGGIEPYTYSWYCYYTLGNHTYGASHFLDDTTLSNPRLINFGLHNIKLILSVSDSLGVQGKDSINVRFSLFAYLAMDYYANINRGDTVTLMHNIGLGIEPLSFNWTPVYNISDPTIGSPQAWPDSSVNYQVIATDSAGCISEPDIFAVYVNPLGIYPISANLRPSLISPNPISNNSTIHFDTEGSKVLKISIFDSNGKSVFTDDLLDDGYLIGDKILTSGFYLYIIRDDSEILSIGKIVKN